MSELLAVCVGAGFALAGGVAGATVSARTAKSTLAKQITAEATRQATDLEEERSRLDATLTHDRELGDLSDLRAALDEAVSFLLQVERAAEQIDRGKAPTIGDEAGETVSPWLSSVDDDARAAFMLQGSKALEELEASAALMSARLRVRLGDDPIVKCVDGAYLGLVQMRGWLLTARLAPSRDKLKTAHDGVKKERERLRTEQRTFSAFATDRAGTVVRPKSDRTGANTGASTAKPAS